MIAIDCGRSVKSGFGITSYLSSKSALIRAGLALESMFPNKGKKCRRGKSPFGSWVVDRMGRNQWSLSFLHEAFTNEEVPATLFQDISAQTNMLAVARVCRHLRYWCEVGPDRALSDREEMIVAVSKMFRGDVIFPKHEVSHGRHAPDRLTISTMPHRICHFADYRCYRVFRIVEDLKGEKFENINDPAIEAILHPSSLVRSCRELMEGVAYKEGISQVPVNALKARAHLRCVLDDEDGEYYETDLELLEAAFGELVDERIPECLATLKREGIP